MKAEIVSSAIKTLLELVKEVERKSRVQIEIDTKTIEDSISDHIRRVKNWSGEISISESRTAKLVSNIYVDLSLYVFPLRQRISEKEKVEVVNLFDSIGRHDRHIVLLGQPGAGKTTSLQQLCNRILEDEAFLTNGPSIPLLIRLREINRLDRGQVGHEVLLARLTAIFNFNFKVAGGDTNLSKNEEFIRRTKKDLVLRFLEKLGVFIIVDGFDELVYRKDRSAVVDELRDFAEYFEKSRIIVSSRTSDFPYAIPGMDRYEIAPLNSEQIEEFASKWLGAESSSEFMVQLTKSPWFDTSLRPLNLAHLCAIYERGGKIPDKPKTIYRKIVNLLLEEWDEQRNVTRLSKYADFATDRKFEFLSQLAFHITTKKLRSSFSRSDLSQAFANMHKNFGLELEDGQEVVDEVESHTGLIIQSAFDSFEFSHKSLQEYLTAEYLVRLPSIPDSSQLLSRLPNELAIAVAISSLPSMYLQAFVIQRLCTSAELISYNFLQPFLSRLITEKPDFNYTETLGVTFLILYTKFVERCVLESSQAQLFISNSLKQELDSFLSSVIRKTEFNRLVSSYRLANAFHQDDGDKIVELVLKRDSQSLHWRDEIVAQGFPAHSFKSLYLSQSLAEKAGLSALLKLMGLSAKR